MRSTTENINVYVLWNHRDELSPAPRVLAKASRTHGRHTQLPSPPCQPPPARRWNIRRARRCTGLLTQQDNVGEDHYVSRLSLPLQPGACGCHGRHCCGTPCAGHRSRTTRRRRSSHTAGSHGNPGAGHRSRRSARCRSGEGQFQQDHGTNFFSLDQIQTAARWGYLAI